MLKARLGRELLCAVGARHRRRRLVVGLFKQLDQAACTGKHRAPAHFTRFSAADDGRLFACAAESGPTAGHRSFARSGRLLTKFGDLIRIEHRHQHLEFRLHHRTLRFFRVKPV